MLQVFNKKHDNSNLQTTNFQWIKTIMQTKIHNTSFAYWKASKATHTLPFSNVLRCESVLKPYSWFKSPSRRPYEQYWPSLIKFPDNWLYSQNQEFDQMRLKHLYFNYNTSVIRNHSKMKDLLKCYFYIKENHWEQGKKKLKIMQITKIEFSLCKITNT